MRRCKFITTTPTEKTWRAKKRDPLEGVEFQGVWFPGVGAPHQAVELMESMEGQELQIAGVTQAGYPVFTGVIKAINNSQWRLLVHAASDWNHAQVDDDISEDEPNTDEETEE